MCGVYADITYAINRKVRGTSASSKYDIVWLYNKYTLPDTRQNNKIQYLPPLLQRSDVYENNLILFLYFFYRCIITIYRRQLLLLLLFRAPIAVSIVFIWERHDNIEHRVAAITVLYKYSRTYARCVHEHVLSSVQYLEF